MHDCPIGGHQGIQRTIKCIKLYLSWPGLDHDVTQCVEQCKVCQLNKETRPNIKFPLAISGRAATPWENVYVDIIGPLPVTVTSMKYILICQDNLSKYFIAVPLQSLMAKEVTDAFAKNVMLIYGIQTEIVTDQGTNFMSDVFKRVCKLFKIEKICTTASCPKSTGVWEPPTLIQALANHSLGAIP
jgi:hypothetical protein